MKSASALISGSTIESGAESPIQFHLPGTSTTEWPLVRCVTSEGSSSVGGDIVAVAVSVIALIASGVTHGCLGERGMTSSNKSPLSPKPS